MASVWDNGNAGATDHTAQSYNTADNQNMPASNTRQSGDWRSSRLRLSRGKLPRQVDNSSELNGSMLNDNTNS